MQPRHLVITRKTIIRSIIPPISIHFHPFPSHFHLFTHSTDFNSPILYWSTGRIKGPRGVLQNSLAGAKIRVSFRMFNYNQWESMRTNDYWWLLMAIDGCWWLLIINDHQWVVILNGIWPYWPWMSCDTQWESIMCCFNRKHVASTCACPCLKSKCLLVKRTWASKALMERSTPSNITLSGWLQVWIEHIERNQVKTFLDMEWHGMTWNDMN